ncbi:MAG: hypothetical protein Q9219_005354 [cf. Caloplaca sp. 3 TL-2023]
MSTTGRRTRASSRAGSSRAVSETSSIPEDAQAHNPSSKGGSKTKRSRIGTRENQTYGSQLAAAGAARMAAAITDRTVGGIEAALNTAQTETEGPSGQAPNQRLDPVEEEPSEHESDYYAGITSRERTQIINRAIGKERSRIDRLDQEMEAANRSNGNQPWEGTSVLQKHITLTSSNTSIDKPLSSFFHLRHYLTIGAFLMMLILLFADVYRGPLLGKRFDLLKSRYAGGNDTVTAPIDLRSVEDRLAALELQIRDWPELTQSAVSSHKINFFSHVHGLAVLARLTSPTASFWMPNGELLQDHAIYTEPTWYEKWISPGYTKLDVTTNGPATVFAPWDESSGPSWCAAAGDGKLQLTVEVDGPMTPTELIVEYNPLSKELHPKRAAAPKEIELWVQVTDDDTREEIGQEVAAFYGDFVQHSGSPAVVDLPSDFVPIGRWEYNFQAPNHLQAFSIPVDLKDAPIHRIAVRINSNWANDPFTCLYRLRLHGVSHHPDAGSYASPWMA